MEDDETLKLPEAAITPTGYRRTPAGGLRWVPPTPEQLAKLLPQYQVECLLGQGGMGAVYKGVQRSLERPVAIKLLPRDADGMDESYLQRFRNEARIMARLDHPSIVPVYDFGETGDGQLYFVMAFVEGSDVHQLVHAHGCLPQEQALRIAMHACDALHYAHTHGIIHRDIKPANVLIGAAGQVKVADFGLAKTSEARGSGALTQTDVTMGTPDFVAPESFLMGAQVDARADLYAVGVMLYQMLCGRLPRGAFDVPSRLCGCDPRFDDIVLKAMQYDREQRYQTAHEIHCDLDVIYSTPMPAAAGQPVVKIATKSISEQLAEMVKSLPSASARPDGGSPPPRARPRPATKRRPAFYAVIATVACAVIGSGIYFGKTKSRTDSPVIPLAQEPGAIYLWDAPEKLPQAEGVQWEDQAVRLDKANLSTGPASRDAILRASIRCHPEAMGVGMQFRSRPASEGPDECYQVELSSDRKRIRLASIRPERNTRLTDWPLPRTYGPDEWLHLELCARGEELTVSLDGQPLGTVRDSSVPAPGKARIFASAHGYFRDIVYIPLDPPGR